LPKFFDVTEVEKTIFGSEKTDNKKITFYDLEHIPELLKKHLIRTRVIGKKRVYKLRIKQKGKIKVDRNKEWRSFTAIQFVNATISTRLHHVS